MRGKTSSWISILSYLLIILVPMLKFAGTAHAAASLDVEPSDVEKEQYDVILSPVTKIYNLIKYGASIIAAIALFIQAFNYMFAGSDIKKRENSKHTAGYVLIGISVIWAAPYIVNLLIG